MVGLTILSSLLLLNFHRVEEIFCTQHTIVRVERARDLAEGAAAKALIFIGMMSSSSWKIPPEDCASIDCQDITARGESLSIPARFL